MSRGKERALYRATAEWRDFRESMKQKQKYCALCGAPLKGRWNLHHKHDCKTIEEYESKNPDDFLCLCGECHQCLHWISRKKSTSKWAVKMKQVAKAIDFGDWVKFY